MTKNKLNKKRKTLQKDLTKGASCDNIYRHEIERVLSRTSNAPLAQLDRVFGYEPKGRGFESLTACQKSKQLFCVAYFFSYKERDSKAER